MLSRRAPEGAQAPRFVHSRRPPPGRPSPARAARIAPDLAVDVISPNEVYDKAIRKVGEYLDAGVKLVWLIDPPSRTVLIFRPDGGAAMLRGSGELSGEDVVPGFRISLGDLFRPPPGTETPWP